MEVPCVNHEVYVCNADIDIISLGIRRPNIPRCIGRAERDNRRGWRPNNWTGARRHQPVGRGPPPSRRRRSAPTNCLVMTSSHKQPHAARSAKRCGAVRCSGSPPTSSSMSARAAAVRFSFSPAPLPGFSPAVLRSSSCAGYRRWSSRASGRP